ncbi:hypothetical protein M0802_003687 [Mischocyttarus mexicanus]|nr:hypothetical protein M0802_003687 [Mischocyttarus mexicanus]
MNRRFIKKCLKKCLTIWKVFVLHRKEKNMLKNQLIDKVCKSYSSNLLHKYFIKWITVHNYIKICKEQFKMMVCYYNKKVLNKSYFMWRAYCYAKVQRRYLKERADQQYFQRLLKRCLKQFVLYIYEVHDYKKKMEMSNTFYESKVITKIFNAWIQWDIEYAKDINKKFLLQEGLKEILKYSLLTMQSHHENRIKNTTLKLVEDFEVLSKYFDKWLSIVNLKEIKYTNIEENLKNHSLENFEENNALFNNNDASIIEQSFSPSSENYRNDIKFKYIDRVIPFNYIKNNSNEQNILFMNSTSNNLNSIPLCNDKLTSSLTNNVELLPPSAFY